MKKLFALCVCLGFCTAIYGAGGTDFKQAKLTQIVNEVQIIDGTDQKGKNAAVNDVFKIPDILRTGPASRAELVAQDQTVTRVGANTIFSFDPASRTIDLKQGSLLFHSPHGKGGGSIHTGSATASVLGSTLIVAATPNGGFKVICLEDKVYITLPNGQQQQLDPGQMTYILPGNSQLAPIVIIRLDDLVNNSLLIIGFVQPLPSMPLIFHQIDQQIKLIQSGQETDTGLLAGDYADPNEVQVLDLNTIQNTVNPPVQQAQQAALTADATINQPSLTSPSIPNPPGRIFFNPGFSLPGNSFFIGEVFGGFAAQNIYVNPPAAGLNPLTVDLSPYSAQSEFDIVAAQNLYLQGSTTFVGLPSKSSLYLIGGNQIIFSQNITLQADGANFEFAAPGVMTLDSINLVNNVGDVVLAAGSTINLNNTIVTASGHLIFDAPNAINIFGSPEVEFTPPGDNSLITSAVNGAVTVTSPGNITVADTSIQAHFLTLNSGDSILLDANGRTLAATGAGATANFTAPNVVTVNNANLASYGVVNMAANTINLFNVAFGTGSSVTLKSLYGVLSANPNTGAVSVPGNVNFIQNVTYGGNPAQNYVNNGGGITVKTLP